MIKFVKGVITMKKFLVSLLICAFMFCTVSPAIAFAAESVEVVVGNVDAAPNTEVSVPVSINNLTVGAFHFEVDFDTENLEYVKCSLGDEFSALTDEGKAIFAVNPNSSHNGKLVIGGAITEGASFSSPIFSLVFKAKDIKASASANVGLSILRLRNPDDSNVENATAIAGSVSINVKPLESITFAVENKFLETGSTFTPEYTLAPADHTDTFVPTWTSGNTEIATVDENGVVTAVRAGSTTITLTCGNISKSFNITVTAVEVSSEAIELNVGENTTLSVNALPEGTVLTYVWRSLDESIATVENGVVTAVAAGSTKIAVDVVETGKTYYFDITAKMAFKKGDLDKDDEISVADALIALRIAAKIAEQTDESLTIGDIDADGSITVSDALAILRVAAKMADSL